MTRDEARAKARRVLDPAGVGTLGDTGTGPWSADGIRKLLERLTEYILDAENRVDYWRVRARVSGWDDT